MTERNASNKTDKMETEKIPKLVFSFFVTTLIGLMLNSVYNLTDTLFVSWGVGDHAMGGVSIIYPFMLLQGAISTMIGGGAASLVARKLGAKNAEEAGKITRNARILFYAVSIAVSIVGLIFMEPLLKIMGATDDLFSYAKDYFTIILIGNVFSTGFSSIVRAEGKILYSTLMWVIPITINIVLDAIFILVLGWGVQGSAAATVISQFSSFVMSLWFFAKMTTQKYTHAKLQWKTIKDILVIGTPSLVQMGSLSITIAILNIVLSDVGGSSGIVAFGYINKLITFAVAPIIAMAQAMAPIVGYNYGLHRKDRVDKTVVFCVAFSLIYACAVLLVAEAIPQYLLMIFTPDAAIIETGGIGIRILALSVLFTPLPMIVGAKFQAIGKTFWAILISGSTVIFIILPTLLLGKYFSTLGVWWAYVIASFCSTALVILKIGADYLKKRKNPSAPNKESTIKPL